MPVTVFSDFLCQIQILSPCWFSLPVSGKVFSVDLPLPVWWDIILISFVGLMDPENIDLAVEIAFLSCLQAEI